MEKRVKKTEVLCQKIGPLWYAFCEIGGEVLYAPLPAGIDPHHSQFDIFQVIEEHLKETNRSTDLKLKEPAP